MTIDIDKMTEIELIGLNDRIVQRLRMIQQLRAHQQMLEFQIGDRVSFAGDHGVPIVGIIARYNRKSVTIITESGQRWNVAPVLLERVPPEARSKSNVIPLR